MSKFFNKMSEIGVDKSDALTAKSLADELAKIHQATYQTDCYIDFINEMNQRSLRFNFQTDSYNIFLNNLSDAVSVVEFPVSGTRSTKPFTRKEKLESIVFHEIRHRVQGSGIDLFNPNKKMPNRKLEKILMIVSTLRKNIFWENMIIFEKEEFDAQFITAVACYYNRLNYPPRFIRDILFWEPNKRH
ncbi:MAG: hypothetical protein ACQEP3_00125 [Patescibacteria group bacterium]